MATLRAICASEGKGTPKQPRERAVLTVNHGIDGDAHAGDWHRQVSLLPLESIEGFRGRGAEVDFGDFGENLVVEGLPPGALRVGRRLRCGGAVLEVSQIGKECHNRCRIYDRMGDCIMPREGVFLKVLRGGGIAVGDAVEVVSVHSAALLTVSDKGSRGEREDASGEAMREAAEGCGLLVVRREIVPDDAEAIAAALVRFCDKDGVSLVLTSGGTGFSRRDVTPEATMRVVERVCPGIPEAMRTQSLSVSNRAMLSRAVAGIRGGTLIVNLPGSPKAVRECLEYILEPVLHGLDVLAGDGGECGG